MLRTLRAQRHRYPKLVSRYQQLVGLLMTLCLCLAGPVLARETPEENAREDTRGYEWGPRVGQPLPHLAASAQSGTTRNLEDLAGEQGLLLFLNRSADW